MRKIFSQLAISALILFGSNNTLANNEIHMKEGIGSLYNIEQNNREAFQNAAKTDEKEDMWLCFNNECYDIGFSESTLGVSGHMDQNILRYVKSKNGTKTIYLRHTHLSSMQSPERISPPTLVDIIGGIREKMYFEGNGFYSVMNEVFNGKGYWTHDITTKLEDTLIKNQGHSFISNYKKTKEETNSKTNLTRKQKIKEFIHKANEMGVILSYEPIK